MNHDCPATNYRLYGHDLALNSAPSAQTSSGCGVPGCKSEKCATSRVTMNFFGVVSEIGVCDDCLCLESIKSANPQPIK